MLVVMNDEEEIHFYEFSSFSVSRFPFWFFTSLWFKSIIDIDTAPIVSQGQTGTFWSFSTTSFIESEIIRLTGKKIDISEMYNVRNTYPKKEDNYVLRRGKAQFGEGGLNHDVINRF